MKRHLVILMILVLASVADAQTNESLMVQRLKSVVIPSIEFRDADALDALTFLFVASTADIPDHPPIQLSLIQTNSPARQENYTYEFRDGTPVVLPSLTVTYRRISVYDTITNIAAELGLTFSLADNELALFKDDRRIIKKRMVEQTPSEVSAEAAAP